MSEALPFAGVKLVDASQGLAGPGAAMMLAQHGADVIKVEPPQGDWSRLRGIASGDFSTLALPTNSGKRSIVLDLKQPAGSAVLHRLVAGADVFLESFRPGVIDRLGFGYDTLKSTRPGLVYASISGFGQQGPMRERPATDAVIQAFSGLMSVNLGESDGLPHRLATWPIDFITSLFAFQAIAVALYARRDHGRGQHIDCSLLQSALAMQSVRLLQHVAGGDKPAPPPSCPTGTFRTSNGWINLVFSKDEHWPLFCTTIERPGLAQTAAYATAAGRIAHHQEINTAVAAALLPRESGHWNARFTELGLLNEIVTTYDDLLRDPRVAATNAFQWIEQPGMGRLPIPRLPGVPQAPFNCPAIGEHSTAILAELGYSEGEIAALQRDATMIQK